MILATPLKRLASVIAGQAPPSDAVFVLADGLPFIQGNGEFGDLHPSPRLQCDSASKIAVKGDILLSVRAPVGAINVADTPIGIGRGVAAIRSSGAVDHRFLRYALASQIPMLRSAATGTTYEAVTAEDIGALTVRTPSIDEQERIADFLDDQVARIDNIIAARRRQAESHAEQWKRLTDDTIGYQAHPRARLALFAYIQSGITVDAGREAEDGVATPYLRVANVQAGSLNLDEIKTITISEGMRARFRLRDGDVLMTEGGDIDKLGRGTVWRSEVPGAIHQNHVFAVRSDVSRLLPEYLAYVTACSDARAYFESTGNQTTNLASTSATKVLDLPVPVRTLKEQAEVVADLDAAVGQHRSHGALLARSIHLLEELKRSLITAAVTGEFDVSSADGSRVPV